MSRLLTMTNEGRAKRQAAWEAGQRYAAESYREDLAGAYLDQEQMIEFLRGIGQWFNSQAHQIATEVKE